MSESFRHLWGRTDKATPPTPDPRERGEDADPEQPSRVAHAILLGAEGLPPKDYARLARAYLALRVPAAPSGGSEVSEVQLSGGRAILYDGLDTRCWWFRDADGELSGQSATLSDLLSAYDLVGELTDAQFIALAALRAGGPTP